MEKKKSTKQASTSQTKKENNIDTQQLEIKKYECEKKEEDGIGDDVKFIIGAASTYIFTKAIRPFIEDSNIVNKVMREVRRNRSTLRGVAEFINIITK